MRPIPPTPRYLAVAPVGLLAAGDWIEIIGALLFFLITGGVQWLQKRSQQRRGIPPTTPETEAPPEPWSGTGRTPPPFRREETVPPEFDLEEQLRRLLNPGQPPAPPTLPSPPPLPPRFDDEPDTVSWESADAPSRPLASLDQADSAYERGSQVEAMITRRLNAAGNLAGASAAFQHASQISGNVSARLRDALGKTSAPAPSTSLMLGSKTSAAAQALSDTLRNPASVKQAVLVSLILQPPKALEPFP